LSRFDFIDTTLPGLKVVQRKPLRDARGFLARFYCAETFAAAGCLATVSQINHTLTHRRGTVRGLHFQYPPHAETKLVSCLHGEVFDVAVDLRPESPTFLRWHAERLSAENQRSLLIPVGFAHGFQTLGEDCEMIYLHSAAYHPEAEGALQALDVRLGIDWPLPVAEMSARDEAHAPLQDGWPGLPGLYAS
jgi:dTDP-4-dehydrorhamnose 3,5-epimerase